MAPGRDRLRELLDSVLADDHHDLEAMAGGAHASPFHFSRQLRAGTGEPPVALRRRVLLERASWQLRRGASVTEVAMAAGFESVDGFSRAFSRAFERPPSHPSTDTHWLPAPNGIHFHPPTSLWVHSEERRMNPLTEQLVSHDLDDTRFLIEHAATVPEDVYRATPVPGATVTSWEGVEDSVALVLEHHVWSKEVWLAAIEGADLPARGGDSPAELQARHDAVAPRWLAVVRELERRGAWDDVLIDALCDPPESFVLSSVIAHVLTYASLRRQLVRLHLRALGHELEDEGDPIMWLRARQEEQA